MSVVSDLPKELFADTSKETGDEAAKRRERIAKAIAKQRHERLDPVPAATTEAPVARFYVGHCIELRTDTGRSLVLYPNAGAALGLSLLECAGAVLSATQRNRYYTDEATTALNRRVAVQVEWREGKRGVRIDYDDEVLWLGVSSATIIGQQLIDKAEKAV